MNIFREKASNSRGRPCACPKSRVKSKERNEMTTNIFGPNRQSIRLPQYDYASEGAYYVTICTQNRLQLFGQIKDKTMHLSSAGIMVQKIWERIPSFGPNISLDELIVMPNHLHGIIWIGLDLTFRADTKSDRKSVV